MVIRCKILIDNRLLKNLLPLRQNLGIFPKKYFINKSINDYFLGKICYNFVCVVKDFLKAFRILL